MPISPDIDDASLVRLICHAQDELSGNPAHKGVISLRREAENLLVLRFDPVIRKFTYRRVAGGLDVDDVVQGFWLKVLKGRILRSYQGLRGASVMTFLIGVLANHVRDELRKGKSPIEPSATEIDDLPDKDRMNDLLEEAELRSNATQLIQKALSRLASLHPKDAFLIRLLLDGVTNTEIIEANHLGEPDLDRVALRQRSSRARKRFGIILRRLCSEKNFNIKDVIEYFQGLTTCD